MYIIMGFVNQDEIKQTRQVKGAIFHWQNTHIHPKLTVKRLKEVLDLHKAVGTEAHRKYNEGSGAKIPVGNWSVKGLGIQSREWTLG